MLSYMRGELGACRKLGTITFWTHTCVLFPYLAGCWGSTCLLWRLSVSRSGKVVTGRSAQGGRAAGGDSLRKNLLSRIYCKPHRCLLPKMKTIHKGTN